MLLAAAGLGAIGSALGAGARATCLASALATRFEIGARNRALAEKMG